MSISRHHAEWLSLLEVSGPFLSMPVLLRAFPQGLDAHDADLTRDLRLAYDEWLDNQGGLRPDCTTHKKSRCCQRLWPIGLEKYRQGYRMP